MRRAAWASSSKTRPYATLLQHPIALTARATGQRAQDSLVPLRLNANLAAALLQTVIQEARVFNETPISPRKCRILLTKIVYLLCVGETFGTQEATTLFFGVTKLFQHKDVSQRFLCVSSYTRCRTT
jgi:hypothetical protein